MRALLAAALLALQDSPGLAVDTSFQGTPAEAMAVIARLAEGEPERAVALADGLAADAQRSEALRAEFRFAQGVVLSGAGGEELAAQAFASARALAGPGELRIAATYNQGTAELRAAEALRMETFRRMQDPAAAGAPSPASGADPLAVLRGAYLRAKATLLERLRADFSGADARANLELIQRRLRELDELEQQAEEERQQQQQQEQQEGEQGEEGEQEPSQGEEQQEQQGEGGEGEQPEQPGEEQQGEENAADAADPLQPQQPSGEMPEVKPGDPSAREPAERVLSREEVLRLLDRLGDLEEEAQALEALLRETRRIPVDKDW